MKDVSTAVSLIGYKKICNLAVGITVLDLFPADSSGGFDYSKFWERSICCGVAAGEIAANMSGELPADVFTVGLVQDIGVLFLVRTQPLEYGGAMGISRTKGVHLAKAEREALGVDHAQVGAVLCANWKLPRLLIEVIRHHHFAEFDEEISEEHKKIVQVVNLASLLVDFLFDSDSEELRERLDDRAKTFFGFGPKKVDELLGKIFGPAKTIGEIFSIQVDAEAADEAPKVEEALTTCPNCQAGDQSGKFCSECGGSLVPKPAEPVRVSNKVLIAEDSIASRRALSFVIKKAGFVPVEATNGYEAFELAKKDPPGMIMLDVMMPRMNGLEALKKIRDTEDLSQIPIVMLTSLTDSETVVEAVQSGANDYIVKPYTADVIVQRLKKYMPKQKKKKR